MNAQQLETLIRQVQSRVDLRSGYITALESDYSLDFDSTICTGNSCKMRDFPPSVARSIRQERLEQYTDKKVLKALYELQRLRAEVKSSRMDG